MKEEKHESGSFLERWSRRKRGLEDEAEQARDTEDEAVAKSAKSADEEGVGDGPASEPSAEKDFADFDFDKLDYDSDYKQFMESDVSAEARQKALRKLWVSNPVLANMDGLDDYCEDYTDAAVCVPKGMLKTAYRYGRGFLDDEEVARWEALGQDSKERAEEEATTRADAEKIAAADADADDVKVSPDPETSREVASANEPSGAADSGPGAACAAAVKQEENEMLAEYEDETGCRGGKSSDTA